MKMNLSTRLTRIEQNPEIQATARREHVKRLLSLPRKELFDKISRMDAQELDAFESALGPLPELDGIDFESVPDVALLALADKELTLDELRERYPAKAVRS